MRAQENEHYRARTAAMLRQICRCNAVTLL